MKTDSYWKIVWKQFCKHRLGVVALVVVALFILMGIYAPLLASSKPLFVEYQGVWYFPLFRYLFYPDFFTKRLDVFYNLLMFTLPLLIIGCVFFRRNSKSILGVIGGVAILQCAVFLYLVLNPPKNPAGINQGQSLVKQEFLASESAWQRELQIMNPYARLNLVLRYQRHLEQRQYLHPYEDAYRNEAARKGTSQIVFPTLWNLIYQQENNGELSEELKEQQEWLQTQLGLLHYEIMPLLRPFHWEDDAGGDQLLNHFVSWWDLTRINRKDMVAALIFGIRISLSVGFLAIGFSLLIGVPVGALAAYYGGKWDLVVYRLIEIWESMPTFFMLLMVVAFLQSKSIFLVIAVIALFGWTGFSRFIRGEFLRQKQMLYVEACHALGYPDRRIIFSHILPNSIPPLLTLIPLAMMGAITSEAGLSFLGLGEEGSNSWGVLMDEGRSAFPSESYLLWPPAILLTLLLVSIALIGDSLRDALDPKLRTL